MSYKVEVLAYGETKWVANALRFAAKEEAEAYSDDLFVRWTQVDKTRVVTSDEPVSHTYSDQTGLNPVKEVA